MGIPRGDIQTEQAAHGLALSQWRQADLAAMGISGSSGDHFLTLGTNTVLLTGNTPSSSTVTDISYVQATLPPSYVAGSDITFRVTAVVDAVADTNTIDLSVYRVTATTGAVGSDLVSTGAQNVTATAQTLDFTIAGGTLAPGDIINLKLTTVNQDADGALGVVSIAYTALVMSTKG